MPQNCSQTAHGRLPNRSRRAAPDWSPDSRYIGFFSKGKLRKVALAGGLPQSLCDAEDGRGGSWSPEGVILSAPSPYSEIHRVAEGGGEPVAVTKGNQGEQIRSRRFPQLLPDGRQHVTGRAGDKAGIQGGRAVSFAASPTGIPVRLSACEFGWPL